MNTTTHNRRGRSGPHSRRRHTSSRTHTGGRNSRNGRSDNRPHTKGGNRGKGMATFDPSQFINTNPSEITEETYTPTHKFSTFGLSGRVVRNVTALKMETPSPIQDQIIPEILAGRDVIGLAETGTGKTAAFLLPLIEKTLNEYDRQTLILTPTRELAIQVDAELKKLAANLKIYSTICVGGVPIRPQIQALKRKNHFIIGTPGRVLDLLEHRHFDPKKIRTVVLDEADRMLDMGFIGDMRKILSTTPNERETLLFSATISKDTEKIVHEFQNDPVTISVKKRDVISSIRQEVVSYKHHDKFEKLTELLTNDTLKRVIVFGAMKHSVEKLAKQLSATGIVAESIHGNKSHSQRQRALSKFKSGNARVLVATDVAARGIHVDNVSHVINYDLPNTFDDYVHRIGRTGRSSKSGIALTFVQNASA